MQGGGTLIAEFSPNRVLVMALGTLHGVRFPLPRIPMPPGNGQSHTPAAKFGPV